MLVHARLPNTDAYHAIMYATVIFNVLPIKGLVNAAGMPATPTELFTGKKPAIGNLRVFDCPVIVKKYEARINRKMAKEATERGIRPALLAYPKIKKGL